MTGPLASGGLRAGAIGSSGANAPMPLSRCTACATSLVLLARYPHRHACTESGTCLPQLGHGHVYPTAEKGNDIPVVSDVGDAPDARFCVAFHRSENDCFSRTWPDLAAPVRIWPDPPAPGRTQPHLAAPSRTQPHPGAAVGSTRACPGAAIGAQRFAPRFASPRGKVCPPPTEDV